MKSFHLFGSMLSIAAVVAACSAAPPTQEETATASAADSVCSPACSTAWTDCQSVTNKGTTSTECVACGAQGQPPCDATGPNPGCQYNGQYMASVNGVCEPCGQHVGEQACGIPAGPYCAPWDVSMSPTQPLMPSGGTCVACGNDNQQECHVGGSLFCNEGVNTGTMCLACDVNIQNSTLCGSSYCNDGTCQGNVVTYCPAAGGPASRVKCGDGCANHGGDAQGIGCSQQP